MSKSFDSSEKWEDAVTNEGQSLDAARNRANQGERAVGGPKEIVARLQQSLPKGSTTAGSFKTGGVVPKTAAYKLHAGETVIPTQNDSTQQQDPSATAPQTAPAQDNGSSNMSDESVVAGEGVNLHRAFSKLQESVTSLFDSLGIRRSLSLPHVDGETMESHLNSLGQALQPVGGVTRNMVTVGHTIHGSGESVAHPSEKLRQIIVPAKYEPAQKAIAAAKSFVNKVENLIGETPEVRVAKSQIALIGRHDGAGMSSFDLGGALLALPSPLIKDLARRHSLHKHSGKSLVHLTGADSRS